MPFVNFLGSVLHSLLSRLLNELDVLHTDDDVSNIPDVGAGECFSTSSGLFASGGFCNVVRLCRCF